MKLKLLYFLLVLTWSEFLPLSSDKNHVYFFWKKKPPTSRDFSGTAHLSALPVPLPSSIWPEQATQLDSRWPLEGQTQRRLLYLLVWQPVELRSANHIFHHIKWRCLLENKAVTMREKPRRRERGKREKSPTIPHEPLISSCPQRDSPSDVLESDSVKYLHELNLFNLLAAYRNRMRPNTFYNIYFLREIVQSTCSAWNAFPGFDYLINLYSFFKIPVQMSSLLRQPFLPSPSPPALHPSWELIISSLVLPPSHSYSFIGRIKRY